MSTVPMFTINFRKPSFNTSQFISILLKKALILIIIVFFGNAHVFAQRQYVLWPYDATSGKIVFNESIHIPAANKKALYENALKFVSGRFKNEKDTIVLNDAETTILCKGTFYLPIKELGERGNGFVHFNLMIWCNDQSYKYSITDLEHFAANINGVIGGPLENEKATSGGVLFPLRYWNEQKGKCYYQLQTTIEQLKEAMLSNIN